MKKKEYTRCEHDENGFCLYYNVWCDDKDGFGEECNKAKRIEKKS